MKQDKKNLLYQSIKTSMNSLLKRWSESSPKPLVSPIVRDQTIQLPDGKEVHVYRRKDQNSSNSTIQKSLPQSTHYPKLIFRGVHSAPPSDLGDYDFYYDKTTHKMVYKQEELIMVAKEEIIS